jgi:predicted dehydrogenase
MKKISWGVLSTARIGLKKVIPAMQKGKHSTIAAIASRHFEKAQSAARDLGIPQAYGSYEELLADSEIDAVYIPLPNHLHVAWTLKALQAGKHVLCEKPLGLNLQEVEYLHKEAKKFPALKAMEAFMYRHHPQWTMAKKLVDEGAIGELKSIHSIFSYHNIDPADIRNQAEIGGGGLLDIGCYCISVSRFLFNREPVRVTGTIDYDPQMKIDRLASGVLEFEQGAATFTCSTQLTNHQRVSIYGKLGSLEIANPFTPQPDESCKLILQAGSQSKEIVVEARDQYTLQGDLFSQAILNDTNVPTPLEDGVANMRVIDGIIRSHKSGAWVEV